MLRKPMENLMNLYCKDILGNRWYGYGYTEFFDHTEFDLNYDVSSLTA